MTTQIEYDNDEYDESCENFMTPYKHETFDNQSTNFTRKKLEIQLDTQKEKFNSNIIPQHSILKQHKLQYKSHVLDNIENQNRVIYVDQISDDLYRVVRRDGQRSLCPKRTMVHRYSQQLRIFQKHRQSVLKQKKVYSQPLQH